MTVQEYIGAGLDITYAALIWIVLYVTKYPDVQRKIHAEIDSSNIGGGRLSASDIRSLPYTEAVVLEVLRHSSTVPLALPHCTTEDTDLNGFKIPRDTFVMVNLHSVNHDETVWDNPAEFNPERFLRVDSAGRTMVRRDRCYQFGFGKRKCVGADFSRTQLVLYALVILQGCILEPPAGFDVAQYSLEPELGIVLKPRDFYVNVRSRSLRT